MAAQARCNKQGEEKEGSGSQGKEKHCEEEVVVICHAHYVQSSRAGQMWDGKVGEAFSKRSGDKCCMLAGPSGSRRLRVRAMANTLTASWQALS